MIRPWWWFGWGLAAGLLAAMAIGELERERAERAVVIAFAHVPLADEAGVWLAARGEHPSSD